MMKIAILGASRGLGRSLALLIQKEKPMAPLFLASRKKSLLTELARPEKDVIVPADFTKTEDQLSLLEALKDFSPHVLFYVAGGGPFGSYQTKNWQDHEWAYQLNLIFPAKLAHFSLNALPDLQHLIFVGSAVAQDRPDPGASSYSSAKHGLKGLCESLQKESPRCSIHLFAPGYMDTEMLPANAWPRQQGLAEDVASVAKRLWQVVGL